MSVDRRLHPRHVSAASMDTNASGIAESTISLGLSRFPEPPSSIPSSPLHSSQSSSRSTVNPSTPLASQSARKPARPEKPSHPPAAIQRFVNSPPSTHAGDSSSNISPFDWHDGASSIDVDETEERLLPTSFITSLLQENKQSRRGNRSSFSSEALSGISEMTYPPLNRTHRIQSSTHNCQGSNPLRPDIRQSDQNGSLSSSNRISGDSDTLHSAQGYPSIIRTSNISRSTTAGMPVVGIASATIRSISSASQTSSLQDSETIGSTTKGYQNKLSTTYESGEELLYDYHKFNHAYSDSLSTPAIQRRKPRLGVDDDTLQRNSIHSQRSVAPSFISRISKLSRRPFMKWKAVKPLPPVPTIPSIPLATEIAYRKQEQSAPLPELVNRAGALRDLLDRGQHPHLSMGSYQGLQSLNDSASEAQEIGRPLTGPANGYASQVPAQLGHHKGLPASGGFFQKKRRLIIFLAAILVVVAAIGTAVGVTLSRRKTASEACPNNLAGTLCNLDATCVCTSTSTCNGIAQNIVDILPTMNAHFGANFTVISAYNSIWTAQGSSTCTSQADLIDTGRTLDQANYPNRTQWTQAAMLWNLLMTQDLDSSHKLRTFVQALPWHNLDGIDGPTTADPNFEITISGFTYNFAAQNLTAPTASFITLGQPANAQIAQVDAATTNTLDRMYSFAQASAIQRQTALKKYWTSVLLQNPTDLAAFKTALAAAPVLLPFNGSSSQINTLFTESPSGSFPPALACYPEPSDSFLEQLNLFESNVFGLSPIVSQSRFDPTCYTDRPVYGVLDVLRLRLPFLDSNSNTVKQAVVLTRDTRSRTILYNGPIFSTISNASVTRNITLIDDPKQVGTPGFADHVVLQYLLSMPNVSIANAVIQFVLNTTGITPPDATSLVFSSLNSIPTLEVAIFGDVQPPDMTSTVSSFSNPSGTLFFGSVDGSALRNWTINSIGGPIVWTLNSTSPLVVRDKSLSSQTTISQTWTGAATAIALHNLTIDGPFIANVLQGTGDFSP